METGFEIEFVKSSQNKYHFVSRDFEIVEFNVLIDAVESSKFVTKDKKGALVSKISKGIL